MGNRIDKNKEVITVEHFRQVNDMLYGRSAVRDGLESMQLKLQDVQQKLDAERAKRAPNQVLIERYERVITRLADVLANAAKVHKMPQYTR